MKKTGNFSYINIGGKYYCRDYGLRKFLGLYFHCGETCQDLIDWRILLGVFLDKAGIRSGRGSIELPACGAWCLRVRGGYKVFDPDSGTATKIFDSSIDPILVKEEIERSFYIGQSSLAPTVRCWNEEERWYSEDYLSGLSSYYFSPESTSEFMRIYYQDVVPCLLELIRFQAPDKIVIKDEMAMMHRETERGLEIIKEKDPEIEQVAREWYEYVCGQLRLRSDETLFRVFAHGDFHLFNLFKTDAGTKLIDWEGIGKQSLLYDFFNYFFSHLWVGRTNDSLHAEITEAMGDIAKRLDQVSGELAASLREKGELYLLMYYLERIHAHLTVFRSSPSAFHAWLNVYQNFDENRRRLMPFLAFRAT